MSSVLSPQPAAGPKLRALGDVTGTRQAIEDNVLQAAQKIQPVSNQRFTLSLGDVRYHGPSTYGIRDQKAAVLTNQSLSRKLVGTWTLHDNATGQPVAAKQSTIAHVPWLTDRGTFINNGSEYVLKSQMRLRPGIFARRQANGELESHVNVASGLGHKLFLDPESGIFRMRLAQSRLPLLPLLRTIGASDDEIKSAWGADLYNINKAKDDPQAIRKAYTKLVRNGTATDDLQRKEALAKAFHSMVLDPDVTRSTLGEAHSNVTHHALLAATGKLLALHRNEPGVEEDDRDHLAYQQVLGPEDLFSEAISKAKTAARQHLWKATARGNLDHIGPGTYTPSLNHVLLSSGLGQTIEEVNTAELLDHQSGITRMGEGGISSMDAVPAESRSVQPSQFGFIDFLRTPESGRAGIDSRLAQRIMKGNDGRIYAPFHDVRTGQETYKSPQDVEKSTIAFPNEMEGNKPMVSAIVGGKLRLVPRDKVDYVVPHMENTFSALGNLIPLKSMAKGQRVLMGARMYTQALSLVDREAPLVQSGVPGQPGKSFEDIYGEHLGARRFAGTVPGQVLSADAHGMQIKDHNGKVHQIDTYDNFPLNRKTFIQHTHAVKPGDTVMPGQLLATSNFTDANGTAAVGRNARVAYIPNGYNFEDASVVSQSFADKNKSEHMYQHGMEWDDNTKRGLSNFVSLFPAAYDRKTLANFDEHGIIKPGTKVGMGHPLILAAQERDMNQKSLHRTRGGNFTNSTITWDHHDDGIVTDAVMTPKGVSVVVKAHMPLQVGDKLSGRFGDKGVVAQILPDHEMFHDENGVPFEHILNPAGIVTRTNPSQIVETALGKIAAKTGKPYKITDFSGQEDMTEFALNELAKHGMADTETVIDPKTGRRIPNIYTGSRWFMKLHHTSESKVAGRGFGAYTAEGQPARGGGEGGGAKRVGMLELTALLSHGAINNIRDINLVRGQANPQHWSQYMAGYKPPTPKVPYVWHKYVAHLQGGGINVIRHGDKTHIMAMTDHGVNDLAGDRELESAETVNWKDMSPVPGGLFDQKLTGGHAGNRWAKITLHEPMPNPVFEEPMRRILGLTEQKFLDVLGGKEQLHGKSGPAAIHNALARINLPQAINQARADIASGKKTYRDTAMRRLGYLKSAERTGIHPSQWMMNAVPVIPPFFRPVSQMGPKKLPLVDDSNALYKELFEANRNLRDASGALGDDVAPERLAVYNAFKGVTGLGDPIQPKNQERGVKGLLKYVFGNSPKTGAMQYRLLGRPVDMVGRAVITPDPDLDMDSVAIPESTAWSIYHPIIVRSLVKRGTARSEALRAVSEKSQAARQALVEEMSKRPVIINRAPVLHRYGVMAAWPRLTKDNVMKVSPLVVKGFGADFDGDQMNFHVPSTDEAVEEARHRMLPSRNLLSATNFRVHQTPLNEYIGGLYEASARQDQQSPLVFHSEEDAIRAYRRGEVGVGRRVQIMGK